MPDKDEKDERSMLVEGNTMIRKQGNVHVATIPSHIMKTEKLKQNKGKPVKVQLVEDDGIWKLEISLPYKLSFDGRFVEVTKRHES